MMELLNYLFEERDDDRKYYKVVRLIELLRDP